jgi:hypothetical protein
VIIYQLKVKAFIFFINIKELKMKRIIFYWH